MGQFARIPTLRAAGPPTTIARAELHRLETVRERARNRELLRTRAQRDDGLIAPVALDARDRAQIDDGAAMDLPKGFRVERLVELLDRLLDQRLAAGGDDFRVLVL